MDYSDWYNNKIGGKKTQFILASMNQKQKLTLTDIYREQGLLVRTDFPNVSPSSLFNQDPVSSTGLPKPSDDGTPIFFRTKHQGKDRYYLFLINGSIGAGGHNLKIQQDNGISKNYYGMAYYVINPSMSLNNLTFYRPNATIDQDQEIAFIGGTARGTFKGTGHATHGGTGGDAIANQGLFKQDGSKAGSDDAKPAPGKPPAPNNQHPKPKAKINQPNLINPVGNTTQTNPHSIAQPSVHLPSPQVLPPNPSLLGGQPDQGIPIFNQYQPNNPSPFGSTQPQWQPNPTSPFPFMGPPGATPFPHHMPPPGSFFPPFPAPSNLSPTRPFQLGATPLPFMGPSNGSFFPPFPAPGNLSPTRPFQLGMPPLGTPFQSGQISHNPDDLDKALLDYLLGAIADRKSVV